MNVLVQKSNDIIKIVVQELESKKDISDLLNALDTSDDTEITFFNVQIIPKDIVIALQKRKDSIKISTNESMLKNYLMTLGFDLVFLDHYRSGKTKKLDLEYLALGGSAGSLSKFIDIIKHLPKSNLSVFIVMHQRADKKSNLAEVLQRYTNEYKVVEAVSDIAVAPNTIYVAPPGKHMIVTGGFIFLTDNDKRNFSKPSISTTFESLSKEYKDALLCVLVCGYGNDGSDSLKYLDENGTTIIIEEDSECEAKAMLQNAIATKHYDHVLALEQINEFLLQSLDEEPFTKEQLLKFLNKIYDKYGYDYTGYNLEHITRRVKLFYARLKPKTFSEFENTILSNISIFKDLFLNISVNITTFYRNPEVFKLLRENILPKLDSFVDIKIWCAGCSSGEEPYSIAIFLKELGLYDKSLIYATDLNGEILKVAQNGLYSKEDFNIFLKHYYKAGGDQSFSKYFNDHGDFVEVDDKIKENILFFKHNLTEGGKINDFQLVFCRNVIIYFDNDLKMKVFDLFSQSLDSYGFLVLGESESLNAHEKYETIDESNKIYKRKI